MFATISTHANWLLRLWIICHAGSWAMWTVVSVIITALGAWKKGV